MNRIWLKKEHMSLKERACLLKSSRNSQMLFAAMMHLHEGPSLETLLILKSGKVPNFLSGCTKAPILPTFLMTGRLMLADTCFWIIKLYTKRINVRNYPN